MPSTPAAPRRRTAYDLIRTLPPHSPADEALRRVLDEQAGRLRAGGVTIHIPQHGPSKLSPGMHMHPNAELFIQVSGRTHFDCGKDSFTLNPDEACLLPPYMGHREAAESAAGREFHNLVASISSHAVSLHLADAPPRGRPRIMTVPLRRPHPDLCPRLERLCGEAVGMGETGGEVTAALLAAVVSLIRRLLDLPPEPGGVPHFKIHQCIQLVGSSLDDPALSVRRLAQALHCAPDYLSHLFCKETGTRLAEYINRSRVARAKHLLEATPLTVKEVAWACGYMDPGYFTRIFHRLEDATPRAWRRHAAATARAGLSG